MVIVYHSVSVQIPKKSSATNMREPPSDFSIRQRFMRLIPAEIHNRMSDRGLFAEYSSLAQLQKHSRAIIEGRKNYRPVGGEATATHSPTASRITSPTTGETSTHIPEVGAAAELDGQSHVAKPSVGITANRN
ncbi:hypothetical protein B0H13DRAFT_1882956 [Mycena leptocephala]|nr:hypothetical protein B0H13DRAFT_1882956 [Mycena leptocephala]